jgi:hypothetical protein
MSATTTNDSTPAEAVVEDYWSGTMAEFEAVGAEKSGHLAENASTVLDAIVESVTAMLPKIRAAESTYAALAVSIMEVRSSVLTDDGRPDYYGATALYKRWVFPRFVQRLAKVGAKNEEQERSNATVIRKALDSARTNYINAGDYVTEYIIRDNVKAIQETGNYSEVEDVTPENERGGKNVVLRLVEALPEDAPADAEPKVTEYRTGQDLPKQIARVVEAVAKASPGEVGLKPRVKAALSISPKSPASGAKTRPANEVLAEAEKSIDGLVDSNPALVLHAIRRLSASLAERVQEHIVPGEKKNMLPTNQGIGSFQKTVPVLSALWAALEADLQKTAGEDEHDALRAAIKAASKK